MEKAEVLKRYKELLESLEKYVSIHQKFNEDIADGELYKHRDDPEFIGLYERGMELEEYLSDYEMFEM